MIQIIFIGCMLALIAIGFHCARNLTSDNPLWVRLIVLAPSMTAIVTLICMLKGLYVAYWADILRTLSVILIYILVGSVVAGRSWLRIHLRKE